MLFELKAIDNREERSKSPGNNHLRTENKLSEKSLRLSVKRTQKPKHGREESVSSTLKPESWGLKEKMTLSHLREKVQFSSI